MSPSHSNTYNNRNKNKVEKRIHCVSQVVEFQLIKLLFKSVRLAPYTAIPNRELQGSYREIWVQGNSNYML